MYTRRDGQATRSGSVGLERRRCSFLDPNGWGCHLGCRVVRRARRARLLEYFLDLWLSDRGLYHSCMYELHRQLVRRAHYRSRCTASDQNDEFSPEGDFFLTLPHLFSLSSSFSSSSLTAGSRAISPCSASSCIPCFVSAFSENGTRKS